MSRYGDIVSKGKKSLQEAHIEDWDTDARLLFEHVFNMDMTKYLLMQLEENDNAGLEEEYFALIEKRCKRVPLQYITGHQEFMGFDFLVNEHTLIPRQDTETLVEHALKKIRAYVGEAPDAPTEVLDMCTGTGCIAISVGLLAPYTRVTASDISAEALSVAKKNAERLHGDNVRFVQSNLFENIEITDADKYDFIISNPPYIRTGDIEGLSEEVRLHEPVTALDGKEDGLYFYRKITEKSLNCLKSGGVLMYETGCDQTQEVRDIMQEAGFCDIEIIKDMAGLNRVVTGRLWHSV